MCVCESHNFFVHLTADGHIGCFHILAIVNNGHWGVCVSFQISVFVPLGYTLRSLIGGPYGSSIFSFLEKLPYCFPQWLHQSAFPPKVYESSRFSTPSPTFVICILFDDSHSDKCQVISYCDFHFLDYYWCWASFLLTIIISVDHHHFLLRKYLFNSE